MSRFIRRFGPLEFAYGFDRPLQEYFFEKCDSRIVSEENDGGYVYQISSHFTLKPHPDAPDKSDYSKGDIIELIEKEEKTLGQIIVLEEHKEAIAMDIPF